MEELNPVSKIKKVEKETEEEINKFSQLAEKEILDFETNQKEKIKNLSSSLTSQKEKIIEGAKIKRKKLIYIEKDKFNKAMEGLYKTVDEARVTESVNFIKDTFSNFI